jgi:hypothetical protein
MIFNYFMDCLCCNYFCYMFQNGFFLVVLFFVILFFQLFMDNLFNDCSFNSIPLVIIFSASILSEVVLKLLFKLIQGFSYN